MWPFETWKIRSIKDKVYSLLSPDLTEHRDGNYLLVWKDVPYWMVVDKELFDLFGLIDGTRVIGTIFQRHRKPLDILLKSGLLIDSPVKGKGRIGPQAYSASPVRVENIALNITRQCNLRCRFCYNLGSLTNVSDAELEAKEIVSFLAQARGCAVKRPFLTILGGEPLLCPAKTIAVAGGAVDLGFSPLISTNGTLITRKFAKEASKMNLHIQVSIDGHQPRVNDPVRGKGTFNKIIAGVKTLLQENVYTILSLVCHKDNLPYLEDFYHLAVSLKVNEARYIPLKRIGGGKRQVFREASPQELILKGFEIFRTNPAFRQLIGRDYFSVVGNTCRYSVKRVSCGTGLQTFLLDADGTIYPCLNTNFPEFRIANIREKGFDFQRVWEGSEVCKRVRELSFIDRLDPPCASCIVRYWCLGGCRGEVYAMTGSLKATPRNCEGLKRAIIEMFWILSEQKDLIRQMPVIC
jgi:radical SAM protein with 4Fe4S-binding SPASM domain